MEFVDFVLTPIEDIAPWGEPGNQSLSWFGFSLGRYRLMFGDHLLLNYSEPVVLQWSREYPEAYNGSFVDYHVVRLWEDILALLPDVLQPVPLDLAPVMELSEADWRIMRDSDQASSDDSARQQALDLVGIWRDGHFLDTGYLSPGACISFWLVDEQITVRWENRDKFVGDNEAWTATEGTFSCSRADFIAGVQAFNDEFLEAMARRVDQLCSAWNRPDVEVDFENLRVQQLDRSVWLARALDRPLAVAEPKRVAEAFSFLQSDV